MKLLGCIWGVGGVLMLLLFAIYRLAPMALALEDTSMEVTHWAFLAFSVLYMAYAEGIKGFHQGFAPRVVKRALHLKKNPKFSHVIFAPFFCMGYFHATKKRQISSFANSLQYRSGRTRCAGLSARIWASEEKQRLTVFVQRSLSTYCWQIVHRPRICTEWVSEISK